MVYQRSPQVDAIINKLKRRTSHTLKGFVSNEESERLKKQAGKLCDNPALPRYELQALERYSKLARPLTIPEADRVIIDAHYFCTTHVDDIPF